MVSLLTNLLEKWSSSPALFRQNFFESYFTGVGVHLSNVTLTRYQRLFVSCRLVLFHIRCLVIHSNVALTLKTSVAYTLDGGKRLRGKGANSPNMAFLVMKIFSIIILAQGHASSYI